MAADRKAFAKPQNLIERLHALEETQRAMLNILEDFDEERKKYQLIQKATMNLLEDVHEERDKLNEAQRSLMKMHEVLEIERNFFLLLQRALLPQTSSIGESYDVAVEYVPAFASREVGGDFYDVNSVSDCRAGILVGDVSGKGLEAAAVAAATRSTIHAFVYETASPAEALMRADTVVNSILTTHDSFVTVFLVVLDTCKGDFKYSSAGHPPAMICRADGNVEVLGLGEMPLGLHMEPNFTERSGHLKEGDKLVLYTDGISEARQGYNMIDIDGIQSILQDYVQLNATNVAQSLVKAATDWSGGKLLDDAAVVVIGRAKNHLHGI